MDFRQLTEVHFMLRSLQGESAAAVRGANMTDGAIMLDKRGRLAENRNRI